MHKKIAGLILRPRLAYCAETGRVRLRFALTRQRRELAPPVERQKAEALFCGLAHDQLYAAYALDSDYPASAVCPRVALETFLDHWERVQARLPSDSDYLTVLFAVRNYGNARLAWARRTRWPLFRWEGRTSTCNPPPEQLHDPGCPDRHAALAILRHAA